MKLVTAAPGTSDAASRPDLWVEYQTRMVDQANSIILFQPVYRIAVRDSLAKRPFTAAGWPLDMGDVGPA